MKRIFYIASFDIIALAILLLVFLNAKKRKRILGGDYLYLSMIVLYIAIEILTDFGMFAFDSESLKNYLLMEISSFLYFLFIPFPPYFWTLYIMYKCNFNKRATKKQDFLVLIPALINTILTFLSLFFGFYFSISPDCVYSRGPLLYISMLLPLIYLLISYILLIKNKERFNRHDFKYMLLYPVPTAVATLLQLITPDLTLIWQFTSISILLLFLNMYDERALNDELTGLMTRKKFMDEADKIYSNTKKSENYVGIIFDLDHFKYINDTFGHNYGDMALIEFSNILVSKVPINSLSCRYGGDEFVTIFRVANDDDIKNIISKIEKALNDFNQKNTSVFKLSASYGYDYFSKTITFTKFMSEIDEKMYKQKELHHQQYQQENLSDKINPQNGK